MRMVVVNNTIIFSTYIDIIINFCIFCYIIIKIKNNIKAKYNTLEIANPLLFKCIISHPLSYPYYIINRDQIQLKTSK